MKRKKAACWVVGIAVILIISKRLIETVKLTKDAASIGIIGGADGPTAIYLTAKVNPIYRGMVTATILALLILLLWLLIKRNRRK